MKTTKSILLGTLLVATFFFVSCEKEKKENTHHAVKWNQIDYDAVKAAISDYVEGIYLVDSTRIERSVDTTLRKIGYWYNPNEKSYRDNLPMNYNQLVSLAARWNKDGSRANESSVKKIEVYDVNTKTASAKLTASWGVDYFHLAKVNNQWKIMNVIWQSIPEEK